MWLSKSVYESLPYSYLAAGIAAVTAGLLVDYGYWPEVCFAVGLIGLVAGFVVLLKRRAYRASRSRLAFDEVKPRKIDR